MNVSAARTLLFGALVGVSGLFGAPASGQAPLVADTLLWPSWSESVAALGLAGAPTPLAQWSTAALGRSRGPCAVAGTVGFTAGVLAHHLRSEPVDWPPGFDYFPARSWRSLPRLGAALGKALVCPPPLTRTPADPLVPARPNL